MNKQNIILTILLISSFIASGQYINKEKKQIVGSWLHEEGSWKLVFTTAMKCYEYLDNKVSDTYKYKISNTSPQCGEKVLVDKTRETSYLELANVKDGTKICYEINGFTASTLSLTGVGYAHPNLFTRQKNRVTHKKKS